MAALAAGLVLTGCAGGDDPAADLPDDTAASGSSGSGSDGGAGSGSGPQQSSSPSTDVTVPDGVTLTEPGAQLSFGDTARVAHEVTRPRRDGGKGEVTAGTVLGITVESATRGSLADLAGFDLTDPYQRRAHYYYVRVAVRNLGERRFGDVEVPLWGISGENTLLPPVRFTSAFARCPTEPLPVGFAPGARFRTCLVFLSPEKGALAGVSYRPTEESTPVEWRGKVAAPQPDRRRPRGRD